MALRDTCSYLLGLHLHCAGANASKHATAFTYTIP